MRYLGDSQIPVRSGSSSTTAATTAARPQEQQHQNHGKATDGTTEAFYQHSRAQRIWTDTVMIEALQKAYPDAELTMIPVSQTAGSINLLAHAARGSATATPMVDDGESMRNPLTQRVYVPGLRRTDPAALADKVSYGKYLYSWQGSEFILYYVEGSRTPSSSYDTDVVQYLVGAPGEVADALLAEVARFEIDLHDEIWVFDGGFWDKSRELYASVEKASWDDVILDPDMKKAIQNDVLRFFESKDRYLKLRVPWKRGVIYHGPPGNGKTVSIKAMMHSLYHLPSPVPTLYVRSLTSFAGDEYSIASIFAKARATAPCLLVFEDLDSLVGDNARSYFLNEVDGLQDNDGVLMIGSTNYLERLDPGISKRPSRFDRKYEFPKPNLEQRVQYCEYWRGKLADNDDVEFPKKLSKAIAGITGDFSFAYIQEAFVAALLAIASHDDEDKDMDMNASGQPKSLVSGSNDDDQDDDDNDDDEDDELDKLMLWREIKKQVKILRDET